MSNVNEFEISKIKGEIVVIGDMISINDVCIEVNETLKAYSDGEKIEFLHNTRGVVISFYIETLKHVTIFKRSNGKTKEIKIYKKGADNTILKQLHDFVIYNKRETYERLIKNEILPILFDTDVMKLHIVPTYDGNQIIIDNVGVLPSCDLKDLIDAIDEYRYIIIDYEIDKVSAYDNMHEVLELFKELGGFDELQPEDEEFIQLKIMEE